MSRSIAQPTASGTRGRTLVTLDGRYHVLERIAAGGMGEVFRAHDAVLAREVAVKVLHPSLSGDQGFVERFRREARAAATLNHTNIVAVYDWGAVDGIYYMVMEYVHGRSVRELMNAGGRLAPAQAAEIVRQTLRALEHAHAKGIVHRDLKPENILLTTDGVAKLTDLGLARAFADATSTRAGAVTGTVQYLSPEQIRGEPADPRSDLYALGIVTFELLTGELPFTGETPMAIAYKHLSEDVPPPSRFTPDVGPELDGFVASATDKDREMRPESARAMRADLETIAAGLPRSRSLAAVVTDLPEVVAPADDLGGAIGAVTETIPRVDRTKRRRWRRWVGLAVVLALVAGAAWGTWTYAIPHSHAVPDLVGASVQDTRSQLEGLGFSVRLADGRFDPQAPEGTVLAIDPPAGTSLREGETVTLVPSLGPPPVPVPSVVGTTIDQARALLEDAHLQIGSIDRVYDDHAPAGQVLAQRPADGKAPSGSGVTLTVSKGHAPVAIPQVVAKPKARAEAMLKDAGFKVTVRTVFSDQIDRDVVVSVDPGEGTDAPYRSIVTLTISLGPEDFATPRLTGLTPSAATDAAEQLGLHVSYYYIPGSARQLVIGQDPEPGATVHYGDTITLFIG
jgi:eukaryotic-like serine/threonine-protein kinase